MMLIQKSLAIMVKEKEQIIENQKKELEEKDKEINRLKEMNKSIEKKNEEIFQFSTKVNISVEIARKKTDETLIRLYFQYYFVQFI